MRLPTRHLWELSPAALAAQRVYTRLEAGDLGDDLTAGGTFQWQQLTAKGSLGGQLYGSASALGQIATSGGCGGADIDALRACEEQKGIAMASAMGTFVGVIGTAIGGPLVGAALTSLWGSLVKAVGFAEAGYGTCDDRTEASQSYVVDPSTPWTTWPYQFYEGNGRAGFYPRPMTSPAPGTFEAFADGLIQADFARLHNCAPPCPNHACGPVGLGLGPTITLAQAIATWNATHSGSVQRTITRFNLNSGVQGGFQSGVYDGADGILDSIGQALNETPGTLPARSSLSFTINDGPAVSLAKRFGGIELQGGPPVIRNIGAVAKQPAASSGAGLGTVVLVGGGALLAVALFKPALLRGVPLLGKMVRR